MTPNSSLPSDEQIEKPIAWWSGNEYGGADEHGKISIGTFVEHEDTWHDIPVYAGWNNEGEPSRTAPPPPPAVLVEPAGFRLVPIEMTREMRMAFIEASVNHEMLYPKDGIGRSLRTWRAALAVAPPVTPETSSVVKAAPKV